MSVAAAGGSDGGDGGDKKKKGVDKGHEDDEEMWSPIRELLYASGSSDDDDDDETTLKRKLSSSPRPGLSKKYKGASKSFGNLLEISDIKEVEKEERPSDKKRRLERAESRKLEDEDGDAIIVPAAVDNDHPDVAAADHQAEAAPEPEPETDDVIMYAAVKVEQVSDDDDGN